MVMAKVEWEGPGERWAKGGNEDTCNSVKKKDLVTMNKIMENSLIILVN